MNSVYIDWGRTARAISGATPAFSRVLYAVNELSIVSVISICIISELGIAVGLDPCLRLGSRSRRSVGIQASGTLSTYLRLTSLRANPIVCRYHSRAMKMGILMRNRSCGWKKGLM